MVAVSQSGVGRASFVEAFHALPLARWVERAHSADASAVAALLRGAGPQRLEDFAALLSPAAGLSLESMAQRSMALTRQRFGKVIRLFAPLYLSNECINNCAYCGFSRDNPILRVTLSPEDVLREARALSAEGFRNLLLVAGEHPKFVSEGYLEACVRAVGSEVPGVSLEVGPMETAEYRPLVEAGAEGLVVYQETYDRAIYEQVHTLGPKKDFNWRLATPERAYAAGFRRLGIGALFGLADWRAEAIAVAAHAQWLLRHCWKAQVTLSLPRLRPCAGAFQPLTHMLDREMVQLICAFRLFLPDVGLVLSTREAAPLRDGLLPLGITLASAGSHTEPGGYTGAGRESVHYTKRGRIEAADASEWSADPNRTSATGQFEIADDRPAHAVAAAISRLGLEPVWKDWDAGLARRA
ncbi:MAG: 2-iminoacetate synthase ThiH [Verrucomicrobiales bacterium]|nr:2-iminoacetate synthase ThiH [Verrucomicrobiales bacterium]